MKNFNITLILCLLIQVGLTAQTSLSIGDIALLEVNENQRFIFMPFVDLEAGTQIYFTTQGVSNSTHFNIGDSSYEGAIVYTAPVAGLPAGQAVRFNGLTLSPDFAQWSGTYLVRGNQTNGINISSNGDQLIIFQDSNPSNAIPADEEPTFLFAVNLASKRTNNNCDPTDKNETQVPRDLTAVTHGIGDSSGSFLGLGQANGCDAESEYAIYDVTTYGLDFANPTVAYETMTDPDHWIIIEQASSNSLPSTYYRSLLDILITGSAALPIELSTFNAESKRQSIELTWTTAQELNGDYFAIERSEDGLEFKEIGQVTAIGNSLEQQQYDFTDGAPFAGRNYYRLRMIDQDGSYEFSKVEIAEVKALATGDLNLFPNPAVDVININFSMAGNKVLRLLDNAGRFVKEYHVGEGETTFSIEISHLPAGLYYVQISVGQDMQTGKFLKY